MKIAAYSPTLRRKEMDAVLSAMVDDRVGPGDRCRSLLQLAKDFLDFDYALALRSPVMAMIFALKALDLPAGAAVLLSALAPRYCSLAIELLNLQAVYADVDSRTANLTVDCIKTALQAEVRAIILHHSLGLVPETEAIAEIGLPIIEDISESYGVHRDGRLAGSQGVFTVMGLEERNVITAAGGALLYAHQRRTASLLRRFAEYPDEFRLPDLNAALAIIQFKEAERNFQKRRQIAAVYQQAITRIRHQQLLQTAGDEPNYFFYPLLLESGVKEVMSYCAKHKVAVELAFPDGASSINGDYPAATSLALRTILFPLYPGLGLSRVEKAAKVLATLP